MLHFKLTHRKWFLALLLTMVTTAAIYATVAKTVPVTVNVTAGAYSNVVPAGSGFSMSSSANATGTMTSPAWTWSLDSVEYRATSSAAWGSAASYSAAFTPPTATSSSTSTSLGATFTTAGHWRFKIKASVTYTNSAYALVTKSSESGYITLTAVSATLPASTAINVGSTQTVTASVSPTDAQSLVTFAVDGSGGSITSRTNSSGGNVLLHVHGSTSGTFNINATVAGQVVATGTVTVGPPTCSLSSVISTTSTLTVE